MIKLGRLIRTAPFCAVYHGSVHILCTKTMLTKFV